MNDDAQAIFTAKAAVESLSSASSKLKSKPGPFLIKHSLFLLPIWVIISIAILLLCLTIPPIYRFIYRKLFARNYQPIQLTDDDVDSGEEGEAAPETPVADPPTYMPSRGLMSDFKAHVRTLNEYGSILFGLEILRVLALGALLGLSIYAAIKAESPPADGVFDLGVEDGAMVEDLAKHWGKKKKHRKHKHHHKNKANWDDYSHLEWEEFGVSFFYAYCLIFAFVLLTLRPATPFRRHIITHLDTLLLLAFCLYAYRDLYPLTTFTLIPRDLNNAITWSRVGLLSLVAFFIPIVRPRTYVPADPENPTPKGQIAPEQVAPWLFFVFYEFMTGMVLKAWKVPSLPYEQIHPMADYDGAHYLYKKHMPNLDPYRRRKSGMKQRHLFFSLIYNLRWEAFITSVMCVFASIFELSGSLGTNQLLHYLEDNGNGQTYRPIVWIALLFIGPTLSSLFIQYYIFVMTRALVRCESIFSSLLFDHALRLRMKDSTEEAEVKEDEEDDQDHPLDSRPLKVRIQVDEVLESVPAEPDHFDAEQRVVNEVSSSRVESAQNQEQTSSSSGTTEVADSESSTLTPKSKKGKGVVKGTKKDKDETGDSKGQGLAGKINVLMAADVPSVLEGRDVPIVLVYAPVQLILCIVFLYKILSWSSLVGMVVMAATLPLPGFITKLNAQLQQKRMTATDDRVDTITEAVGALRMIKMFGWEDRLKERVSKKRETEIRLIWQRRLTILANSVLNTILPVLTMAVTFAFYTAVQKRELTAATVFTSMTVFELIKGQLGIVIWMVNEFVTAGVSLNRINTFLQTTEMVDEFTDGFKITSNSPELLEAQQNGLIWIKNATFTWGSARGTATPAFSIYVPEIKFVKGKINLITGMTGSGKSSLLKSLIGELHFTGGADSFFHLPREGGVSYAAQESWLMSETLRNNILFGEPYDENRYRQVLRACALETDLKLLDDGDQTEIGEKGVTLSGGQKARVTLARAVYCKTDIVLLDDVFSALDTLTSRWVLEKLFKGDLMKDRTVLLITHHVAFAAPIADYLVTMDEDGRVRSAGPMDQERALLSTDEDEQEAAQTETATSEIKAEAGETKPEEEKGKKKLVQAEEKSEGRISRRALFSFFSNFGGPTFWFFYWFLLFGGQAMTAFQTYWLGRWARAYNEAEEWRQVSISYYLGLYVVWVVVGVIMITGALGLYYIGAIKASRNLHRRLVDSIFAAYMRFLDVTPVGRIISRFTKDMKSIDGTFTETAVGVFDISVSLIIKFGVVVSLVPLFSIPAVAIGALGGILGELYIHSQLSIKREMSNAKSPLFSHFSAAVNGIVSIRAFGAQDKMRAEAWRRADTYTRAGRAFFNLNRWVTVRIDMLGALFASLLAAFLVYGPKMNASTAGFALSQAISFSSMILWWIRLVNEMEVEGNSVERIEDYLKIDQEPRSTRRGTPPAAWPTSGEVILDNLSAKYSKDGPTVLDKLNVRIASGEKIGIVGRTGSGKSTLSLAMLRLIPTTGSIIIDGKRTEDINLEALRSNVTIIPQDPILLSGSLRFNLDPFGDHDDATLNDALQSSGLGLVSRSESGTATPQRLTLDFQVSAAGGNLSQGQRQLVALARALVRASKVLILDEATASVDFETDALIQKSIRDLPASTTVLTVAHRLSTVMDYDKILVLGAGKVLEFDSPDKLRRDKDSYFAKLVKAMEG